MCQGFKVLISNMESSYFLNTLPQLFLNNEEAFCNKFPATTYQLLK